VGRCLAVAAPQFQQSPAPEGADASQVLPWTVDHALELFDLPLHHPDPFDRQIIAQAISEDVAVVTSDAKFKLYSKLSVIW
jgi:PIN domain nuclease of toxin-antitoxin system